MTVTLIAVFAGLAGGLDLFLAIALLSLWVQLSGVDLLGAAEDLGTWWLFASSAILYAVEAFVERTDRADLIYRLAGLAIRPAGAGALAALLSDSPGAGPSVPAVLGAMGLALVVHALRSGWAFLGKIEETRPTARTSLLLEDVCVTVLVAALLFDPVAVGVVAIPVLGLGVLAGPRLVTAFAVSVRLTKGAIRAVLGRRGWRSPARFPNWMKRQLAPTAIVTGGRLRASPAACFGHPGSASLSRGWLVVRGREPRFVRPVRRGVDALSLLRGAETDVSKGPLWSTVRVTTSDLRSVLLVVGADGPKPDELRRELR